MIDVNLTGAFLVAQAAARPMVQQGRGGSIVNVTSVHERIPLSGSGPYTASKHGLGGLTKVAARASDEASYVTGASYVVDGRLSLIAAEHQ